MVAVEKRPETRNLGELTVAGALGGAFWGLLFGLIIFVPFLGMAVGAALGFRAGKFSTHGIDRSVVKSVGEQVTKRDLGPVLDDQLGGRGQSLRGRQAEGLDIRDHLDQPDKRTGSVAPTGLCVT